jgi:hypothetical protein
VATKRAHDPPRPESNGQRSEEYDRFERLTKKLVAVPEKEIEKQAEKRKKAG